MLTDSDFSGSKKTKRKNKKTKNKQKNAESKDQVNYQDDPFDWVLKNEKVAEMMNVTEFFRGQLGHPAPNLFFP